MKHIKFLWRCSSNALEVFDDDVTDAAGAVAEWLNRIQKER